MAALIAIWKFLRGLWHVLLGMWTIYVRFPQLSPEQREMRVQAWALQFLALWGIHLRVLGQPVSNGPALMVANHISWLDILVIHAARHCRFVSKSDIRDWPLVGMLATGAGTLYIERTSRKDALRMVKDMASAMRLGDVVAVFPEGTTSDGQRLLPFHGNLVQSALNVGVPIVPVGLRYVDPDGEPSHAAAFVGDTTFLASVWRITAHPKLIVEVHVMPAIEPAPGLTRQHVAREARAAIAARLGLPLDDTVPETLRAVRGAAGT